MLCRYAALKGQNTDKAADLSVFVDAGAISSYASASMQWAVASGILNGTGAHILSPGGTATRAQASAMLMRFLEQPNS